MMKSNNSANYVIFFDGVCGLCNGFVDFVMKIDKQKLFKFSPLQSEFARGLLSPEDVIELKSVIVQINGRTYKKSDAVFAVFKELGGSWKALQLLKILPRPLRNSAYDMVAKYRYKIFGKKESCRLPSPEERQRFIL
jgi:predicted DCC family thiol-disulfide oxidoreductase YuxK